jgi:ribosomal protein S18 acetylase RimI-like enzyme
VVRDGQRIELAGIQLLPAARSRGIGTSIITELQVEAACDGIPMELLVERDNHRARALYERLGFVFVGTDEDEDHLRWQPASVSTEP